MNVYFILLIYGCRPAVDLSTFFGCRPPVDRSTANSPRHAPTVDVDRSTTVYSRQVYNGLQVDRSTPSLWKGRAWRFNLERHLARRWFQLAALSESQAKARVGEK